MPPKIRLSVLSAPVGAMPPTQLVGVVQLPLWLISQVKVPARAELSSAPPAMTPATAAANKPRRRRIFFNCGFPNRDAWILDMSLSSRKGRLAPRPFLTYCKHKRCKRNDCGLNRPADYRKTLASWDGRHRDRQPSQPTLATGIINDDCGFLQK